MLAHRFLSSTTFTRAVYYLSHFVYHLLRVSLVIYLVLVLVLRDLGRVRPPGRPLVYMQKPVESNLGDEEEREEGSGRGGE